MTGSDRGVTNSDWGWWRDRRPLDEHGIVTTACTVLRAPLGMAEPLLRVSPHVDVTPDDLTRLRQALLSLT